MLDILIKNMQEEVDEVMTLLGQDSRKDVILAVVKDYNLDWMDTKFCIARLMTYTSPTNKRRKECESQKE